MIKPLLVIGDNAFDIIIKADLKLQGESNVFPKLCFKTPAGSGVNFAVASSKLGLLPFYFTPISTDLFGKDLEEYMKNNKIEYSHLYSAKDTPLIITLLNDQGGRNTIAMVQNTSYTDISFDSFLNLSMTFDWAYISGGIVTEENPQREVLRIAEFIAQKGTKIFFDPQFRIGKGLSGFSEASISLIELSSFVFSNEHEFNELPKSIIEKRLKEGCTFVIKKGANGATLVSRNVTSDEKGLVVNSVDTTGAGDIFNASFMNALSFGKSLRDCLSYANRVAALSTEKMGIFIPEVPQ
jgi:ribokinase